MGNALLHRRARGVVQEGGPETASGDYDFQETLGNFNKEEEMAKLSVGGEEGQDEEKEPAYNKQSSFFDSISCDAIDRLEGKNNGRMRAAEERKLNTETFGAVSLNDNRGRHRGGRGRGGGKGKGKGKGGDRGKGGGGKGGDRRGGKGQRRGKGMTSGMGQ
jgi:protein LSM14